MPKKAEALLSYQGVVTIKKYNIKRKKIIKSYTVKNAGTKYLFQFLCNCIGDNHNTQKGPKYLDASAEKPEIDSNYVSGFKSCLSFRSIMNKTNVYEIDNNYHIKFSCTIIPGQINAGTTIKSLIMSNSSNTGDNSSSILTWVNLEVPIEIGDGEATLIEWDMSFDNK